MHCEKQSTHNSVRRKWEGSFRNYFNGVALFNSSCTYCLELLPFKYICDCEDEKIFILSSMQTTSKLSKYIRLLSRIDEFTNVLQLVPACISAQLVGYTLPYAPIIIAISFMNLCCRGATGSLQFGRMKIETIILWWSFNLYPSWLFEMTTLQSAICSTGLKS